MTIVRRRAASVTSTGAAARAARISVLSAGSAGTGAPLSFAGVRGAGGGDGGGPAMPPAGAAISEATSYLYTAQHLLREGRPGRASDYLRSSLGLLAALVASGRLNDVIVKGIAEAHLYLAKAALALEPHPPPPDDAVSHYRRAKMAFASVKDRRSILPQLKELQRTHRTLASSPVCLKLNRKLIDRIPHPLQEMGAMRHDLRPDCYYYYYYQRCALPIDLHPALLFGRERSSVEGKFRAPPGATLPTKGRRRMVLIGRRQWAPLKSGYGEVPGRDRGSRDRVSRDRRSYHATTRTGTTPRRSLNEAARAAAADWRRRFSLSALGRARRSPDAVAEAARAAAKAARARDSPTASSSATDPSTATDDSLARAHARLRTPRPRPPLAAPIPTRRDEWRREQKKIERRSSRFFSRLSRVIGVR